MASSKKGTSAEDKRGNQPKATARHAKMTQSKKDEIENLKNRISTDKYLAKKYESNRKTEIKALPKEDRAAAKEELKESIAKRKEAEMKDKDKLRELVQEDKREKGRVEKEPFDEDAWVKGGKKKAKDEETSKTDALAKSEAASKKATAEDRSAPAEPSSEPAPKKGRKSKK